MPDTGWLTPASVTNDPVGEVAWTNPSNAATSNNTYATVFLDSAEPTGDQSDSLKAVQYGVALPAGATVNGFEVRVEKKANSSTGARDQRIKLLKAGVDVGTNKADGTTDWSATDTQVVYGGATDLWGTTWTESEVENTNFGVHVAGKCVTGSRTLSVDEIAVKVYYTAGQTIAVGTVTETDSALALGRRKQRVLGLVTEADTALLIRNPVVPVGLVTESDVALPIASIKRITLGMVVETDTALSIGRQKRRALGIVAETDTAMPMTKKPGAPRISAPLTTTITPPSTTTLTPPTASDLTITPP